MSDAAATLLMGMFVGVVLSVGFIAAGLLVGKWAANRIDARQAAEDRKRNGHD